MGAAQGPGPRAGNAGCSYPLASGVGRATPAALAPSAAVGWHFPAAVFRLHFYVPASVLAFFFVVPSLNTCPCRSSFPHLVRGSSVLSVAAATFPFLPPSSSDSNIQLLWQRCFLVAVAL